MRGGFLANLSTVGGFTLLSRILGFARDIVFATHFGAGYGMDAFLVAFKIPNFGRRLFAEGAFSQAFVPVLAEYRATRPESEVRELVSRTEGSLAGALALLSAFGVLLTPVFIWIFAPGFHAIPGKFELATDLLRLTFPYLFFISLVALAGGVLNAHGSFGPPAFAPVLLNIAFIVAALFVAPHLAQGSYALAGAVLVAGALQFAMQLPYLARHGMLVLPRLGWRDPGVRRIFRLMVPVMFGASVTQLNLLVDTVIASFLASGSVSWLYYSDRLMEFPLGVFAVALGTIILPGLAGHHVRGEHDRYSAMLDRALRLTAFAMPAAAIALIVLAGPLVATLFGYGKFSDHDVAMTRASLVTYAAGLTAFSLVKVLLPAWYARQQTRKPVRIGILAVGVNLVFNGALVVPWALTGGVAPHAGLALATSLAAVVNAALLWRGLRGIYRPLRGWTPFLLRIAAGCVAMAAGLVWAQSRLSQWLNWRAEERVLHLVLLVLGGACLYLVVLGLAGLRPRHLRLGAGEPDV
ncbi:MAG TPA: murein biosynthesis integral membrane protein MurJ [Gammaproteobacteria bacterium]|nr:murein biosynthesis integral membrane protein MurJ [Gammaproteobacteria bacterium]